MQKKKKIYFKKVKKNITYPIIHTDKNKKCEGSKVITHFSKCSTKTFFIERPNIKKKIVRITKAYFFKILVTIIEKQEEKKVSSSKCPNVQKKSILKKSKKYYLSNNSHGQK